MLFKNSIMKFIVKIKINNKPLTLNTTNLSDFCKKLKTHLVEIRYNYIKKRNTVIKQDATLVLAIGLVVFFGTYVYESFYIIDIESYIRMYDENVRKQSAASGLIYDKTYYEGIYNYWRLQHKQTDKLTNYLLNTIRGVCLGVIFYSSSVIFNNYLNNYYTVLKKTEVNTESESTIIDVKPEIKPDINFERSDFINDLPKQKFPINIPGLLDVPGFVDHLKGELIPPYMHPCLETLKNVKKVLFDQYNSDKALEISKPAKAYTPLNFLMEMWRERFKNKE